MIIDLKRAAAYICPFCGRVHVHPVSLFSLNSALPASFRCSGRDCGEECVSISRRKRGFQIEIECPACGDVHPFSIPAAAFFSKPLSICTCPVSGIHIFFFGFLEKVKDALDANAEAIETITADEDYSSSPELKLLYTLVSVVHELMRSGQVHCTCKSRDITCTIDGGQLSLTCGGCGASVHIPPTQEALDQLLANHAILIEGN